MLSNFSTSDIFEQKRVERSNRRAKLLEKKARDSAFGAMLDMPIISYISLLQEAKEDVESTIKQFVLV